MSILSTLNKENAIRMKIINAIEIHQKAIELVTCTSILLALQIAQLYINFYGRKTEKFGLHDF